MKFIDASRPVFIIAPNPRLAKDVAAMYMEFNFEKQPRNFLCDKHSWERVQGFEKFHVIELISARPWGHGNIQDYEYKCMIGRVRDRWNIVRCRHESFGNMWIEVNLP
jgi:hypothetical protein